MKVNILNRMVVAFAIIAVLLVGTSVPANAQEDQSKQQRKQERKQKRQAEKQQQAPDNPQTQPQPQADQKQIKKRKDIGPRGMDSVPQPPPPSAIPV